MSLRLTLLPCFFDILVNHVFVLRIDMFNLNMFVVGKEKFIVIITF